ncbi:MAG: formylglycine-generating enzyme family protein [Deltaproteobacteria bacterium]|jgi:formylglycine-generating enzyme required for sulfatase activity|nr:formylglycine-generating enzyme family protein [Deltaproteobacteria bacterium]
MSSRNVTPLIFLAVFLGGLIWEGETRAQEFRNAVGMEFIYIAPGSFFMGEDAGTFGPPERDETPQHRVYLNKGFYLGKFEVTQREWETVMGWNRSAFPWPANPVDSVSHEEAQEFIARLNRLEGAAYYRLPTEAEWEYCARAGSSSFYSYGSDPRRLGKVAWHSANSSRSTHAVGALIPNPWGLYDIHGNIWEWTGDWHQENYYQESPFNDPQGPLKGTAKVFRGCGWDSDHYRCRVTYRNFMAPNNYNSYVGLRVLRMKSPPRP